MLTSLLLPNTPAIGNDPNYFIRFDMHDSGVVTFQSINWVLILLSYTVVISDGDGVTATGAIVQPGGGWAIGADIAVPKGTDVYIGYEGDKAMATISVECDAPDELASLSVAGIGDNDLTKTVKIEFDDTKTETQIQSALEKCRLAIHAHLATKSYHP